MRKTRCYTETEKAQILEEVRLCGNMTAVAKKNNMPVGTIATWIKPKYKKKPKAEGVATDHDAIKKLKSQLADSELENKILKELLKKTYQIWDTD